MGKPAFLFTDYHPSATVTATDTLTGTDADNILLATEDTVWSPADATGTKDITIDLFSAFTYDSLAFLGENLDGVQFGAISSSDDFILDSRIRSTGLDLVTNGDFAAGGTGWTYGPQWSVGIGLATYLSTGSLDELEQTVAVESGKNYLYSFDILTRVSITGTAFYIDGVQVKSVSSVGSYTGVYTATATGNVVIKLRAAGPLGATLTTNSIKFTEIDILASLNNTAFANLTNASDRYLKITIFNPATSLQIAHIAPDLIVEQPWLETDWGTEGVQSEFKNLISVDGYYLGTTQTKTMRDININFGEITDTEYTGQVEPWVTSRIKTSSAFFFIPDVDDLTEVYFCWLVDGQGFKAPLKQGVRMVENIRCLTRLA